MVTQDLKITGMHCIDCAHTVEAALKTVPGVEQARVLYLGYGNDSFPELSLATYWQFPALRKVFLSETAL